MTPIYYVVFETMPQSNGYPVYKILKVFACDLSDIDEIWRRDVDPLQFTGRGYLQAYSFYREPANPFREAVLRQENEELKEKLKDAEAYIENVDTTRM